MGTLHHVVHAGAKAITVHEFMDAVRATCTPRFPGARGLMHRRAAIAVSGGVDSMALAFLCSRTRKIDPEFKIADNPVSGFRVIIVDHGLRKGSTEEAHAVSRAVRDMGLIEEVATINWAKVLSDNQLPKDLTNIESMARTLRYRKLGAACVIFNIASLLLAHHKDDQYETVLMRMLQGHGIRGLRGMRAAQDIPECEGLFGADKSGFVDDQARDFPFYNFRPTRRERKYMRREFGDEISKLVGGSEPEDWAAADLDAEEFYKPKESLRFEPKGLDIEDGGITIFRPLLEFSKDRLIATCLENNIPWWDDATNKDPTLTTRNAIRHLYKGYTLPKALQKPAILELSRRCERKVQAQEAEANRLLTRTIIHDLELLSGTTTVQFPKVKLPRSRRDIRSPLRRRARILRKRQIAAILIRKIILLVSPDPLPLLSTLENHITPLLPSLALPEELPVATPPKAFSIAGVHLVPVESTPSDDPTTAEMAADQEPVNWYISRMPYPSTKPLPRVRTPYWASSRNKKGKWIMSDWMPWSLWDGRYWFRIQHRFPYRVLVLPFLLEHAKDFRENLPPADRKRLAALLKRYAPGKVRFTLPAFYLEEPLDLLDPDCEPRPRYPMVEWGKNVLGEDVGDYDDGNKTTTTDNNHNGKDGVGDGEGEGENGKDNREKTGQGWKPPSLHPVIMDTSMLKLIALPTLGIKHPGLDEWMEYETRYRKVDRNTTLTAGTFDRGSFAAMPEGGERITGRVRRVGAGGERLMRGKGKGKGKG
ncbi:uncharacterized protein F4812DRAFT_456096 [Daldinia caldariorum]|uniref:uncharacterized protein n=1 Tax=Daldinia caldariorum TaxID=326644 RepID=UPI002008586A|nr:uncharacterized protein F4812DRAFT_456096 [Daldinia caldariorum]KAI1471996.1 hypothetical protein F4812DRAFT_456096 [Daldinia caldariorum]